MKSNDFFFTRHAGTERTRGSRPQGDAEGDEDREKKKGRLKRRKEEEASQ